MTTDIIDAAVHRLNLTPSPSNGLRHPSQIMVEKIMVQPRAKCSIPIGRLSDSERMTLDRQLLIVIGIADVA